MRSRTRRSPRLLDRFDPLRAPPAPVGQCLIRLRWLGSRPPSEKPVATRPVWGSGDPLGLHLVTAEAHSGPGADSRPSLEKPVATQTVWGSGDPSRLHPSLRLGMMSDAADVAHWSTPEMPAAVELLQAVEPQRVVGVGRPTTDSFRFKTTLEAELLLRRPVAAAAMPRELVTQNLEHSKSGRPGAEKLYRRSSLIVNPVKGKLTRTFSQSSFCRSRQVRPES